MSPLAAVGPNAEQITYWNETSGAKWVALADVIDAQIAPLGRAVMERAGVRAGERVLDVGCGCGHTSAELAERVGREGAVLGADLSAPMLEAARRRAASAQLSNVRFENVDAQTHAFAAESRDLVYSRFGVMFFADPRAAFANLRRALRPDGRLAFVCWQALARNDWARIPLEAAARHVPLPPPPAPGAPGPFSFADAERVRGILEAAGFAQVRAEPLERELVLGGEGADLDEAVRFVLQAGPTGAALREAPESARARVPEAVREAIAPYATPQGVRMASASWVVTAVRAG